MSDDKKTRAAEVRERLGDAIGNGQIHPALADYLALVDDELQGAADRHEQLVADLAAKDRADTPDPEPDPEPGDAKPTKATPAAVANRGK